MAKTIKNSMVTSEQYDKLQVDLVNRIEELEGKHDTLKRDYDMVRENGIEYAEWSRGHRTQMKSTIKTRGYWIAGLATLSLIQSVALIFTTL